MKKVTGNNHDYASVASKLAKKAIVKELATLKQPLLAPFFNGLLNTPPPMSVLTLVFILYYAHISELVGSKDRPSATRRIKICAFSCVK